MFISSALTEVLGDGLRIAGGILIAQRDDAADRARSIG